MTAISPFEGVDHKGIATTILDAAKGKRVLVVGDVMMDKYTYGRVRRISPEAPVPVLEVFKDDWCLGGAGNVAANLRMMGAEVVLVGVVGRDTAGERAAWTLNKMGVDLSGLEVVDNRPTTTKQRFVTDKHHHLLRSDYEWTQEMSLDLRRRLEKHVDEGTNDADGVVISDYRKGVVTDGIIALARAANAGGRMIVGLDTKPEVLRRLSMQTMTGITFVKPNRAELFATLGMTDNPRSANHRAKDDTALTEAITEWFGRDHDVPGLFVTLGQEGMAVSIDEVTFYMPALGSQVVEVSGAGDTAIAAFMLGMLCSDGPESTLTFAAQAAAVAVGQSGTGVASRTDILAAIERGAK